MTEQRDLKAEAAHLRRQGLSLAQIARRLGISTGYAGRLVAGLPFDGHSAESLAEQLAARRDPHLYNRALQLRQAGWSYNMISAELGVNKSTLSGWLRHVAAPEQDPEGNLRKTAGNRKAVQVKKLQQQAAETQMREQALAEMHEFLADGLGQRELFLAGLMLYWAEGGKTQNQICLTNSDPAIMRSFVLWLVDCLYVDRSQLRGSVHIYPDVDVNEAESYWSEVVGIPRSQFYKAQIDTRTAKLVEKRGKLKCGTLHLVVLGQGTSNLHRKIMAWVEGFSKHIHNIS